MSRHTPDRSGSLARVQRHREAVKTVYMAGLSIVGHDLPELLRAIERADAFGPILDPTLYRDRAGAMHEDRELLEAALPLWRFAQRMKARGRGEGS